jgi:uncharacterized protein
MRRKEREISDPAIIDDIIRSAEICRVAFADNNIPYIIAMNFGFSGGDKPSLYFHCAPSGRKLEMMKKNDYVCFQLDTDHLLIRGDKACDWGMKYRSIVGYGRLSVVENNEERRKGLDLIMDHYGGLGKYDYEPGLFSRTTLLRLDIKEISAKQT